MLCVEIHITKKSHPYFKTQIVNPESINPEKYKEELEKNLCDLNQQENLERCLTIAARSILLPDKCTERRNKLKESTRCLLEEREKLKSEAAINLQKKERL